MFTWKATAEGIRDGRFLNFFEEVLVDPVQHHGVLFLDSDAVLDQEAGQSIHRHTLSYCCDSIGSSSK